MPDVLASPDWEFRDRALTAAPTAAPVDPAGGADPTGAGEAALREAAPRPASAPVLVLERVSKWFGPVIGVNQVSLELRPGITGLVGHNGAGKSTLLRLAAGQLQPDLGSVLVAGCEAWSPAAKRQVGYCPELDVFYEEMSGRQFVLALALLTGFARRDARRRTEDLLELVGMRDRADRPLAVYSKGMRQRIKLAQALLADPPLLLLDEPLSGIDPLGRRESIALFQQIAALGKCLLISSHELDELEKLTDHVAIMAAGRIAAVGTLTQIRELLDNHPHTIALRCEQHRQLAAHLLAMDEVLGFDRDGDQLTVRTRHPQRFFEKLSLLVIHEHLDLSHLQTVDSSTQDVLGYLLGGKAR